MTKLLAAAVLTAATPAVTIDDLLGVVDPSGLAVSPDGNSVAFRTEHPSLSRDAIETRWYVAPVDGSAAPRRVAEGGDALQTGWGTVAIERAQWLPDGSGFLFRAARDGEVQVWCANLTSGGAVPVTHDAGDVSAFAVRPDGQIDYRAGAPRAVIAKAERVLRARGGRLDTSVDLSVGLVGGAWGVSGPRSVRLTGEWFGRRGLLDPSARVFRQSIGGAPGPTDSPPPPQLDSRPDPRVRAAVCAQLDCAVDRVNATVPVPALGAVLVTTSDAGQRQTLRLWRNGRLSTVRAHRGLLSGARLQGEPCAIAGTYAVCVEASADAPPQLVRLDLRSGAITSLFAPNAELAARTVGRARLIEWRSGGRGFVGQLLLPSTARPATGFPLVIQYYWCDGFLRGGIGDELPMFPLQDRGVAVLCANRAVVSRPHQDSVADYRTAEAALVSIVDRLARDGLVDRALVGMQGVSFGSEATMWIARRTRLLRAAAIGSGQLEPSAYWFTTGPGRDAARLMKEAWGLGDPDRTARAWSRVSPARDAVATSVPLLLQLPESEARWSVELLAKLARGTVPAEAYVFPDATHVKGRPRQRQAAYERNLAWFRFWLMGAIEPAVDDPDRAARWRALARMHSPEQVGRP